MVCIIFLGTGEEQCDQRQQYGKRCGCREAKALQSIFLPDRVGQHQQDQSGHHHQQPDFSGDRICYYNAGTERENGGKYRQPHRFLPTHTFAGSDGNDCAQDSKRPVIAIMVIRDDGLDKLVGIGGTEKWLEFESILKSIG